MFAENAASGISVSYIPKSKRQIEFDQRYSEFSVPQSEFRGLYYILFRPLRRAIVLILATVCVITMNNSGISVQLAKRGHIHWKRKLLSNANNLILIYLKFTLCLLTIPNGGNFIFQVF